MICFDNYEILELLNQFKIIHYRYWTISTWGLELKILSPNSSLKTNLLFQFLASIPEIFYDLEPITKNINAYIVYQKLLTIKTCN